MDFRARVSMQLARRSTKRIWDTPLILPSVLLIMGKAWRFDFPSVILSEVEWVEGPLTFSPR